MSSKENKSFQVSARRWLVIRWIYSHSWEYNSNNASNFYIRGYIFLNRHDYFNPTTLDLQLLFSIKYGVSDAVIPHRH